MRWLLLLLFLVGFITCQNVLGDLGVGFFALTCLDTAACALLLSRFEAPLEQTLWAWIGLILILDAYFARMFWIVNHLNQAAYINRNYYDIRWVTRDRILAGYPWASAGFLVFCIAASAALTLPHQPPTTRQRPLRSVALVPWTRLVVGVFLVYLVASLLQLRLGYGIRGVANPSLPFRLGTLIAFLREEVVPSVLVLAVWIFDKRNRRWTNITLILLFVSGVLDSLLSTSRGELLLFTVPVFALWGLTSRFTPPRKWALATVLIAAAVLVPLVSAERVQRISGTSGTGPTISLDTLTQSAFFLGDRAGSGGIEAIWYSLDHKGTPSVARTLSYLRPYTFTRYYTYTVVGIRTNNDYRSSGMFGAFIIIGSGAVLVALTLCVVLLIVSLWILLRRLRTRPVALALATVTVALIIVDPTGAVLTIPKLLIAVGVCEVLYRRLALSTPTSVRSVREPA